MFTEHPLCQTMLLHTRCFTKASSSPTKWVLIIIHFIDEVAEA